MKRILPLLLPWVLAACASTSSAPAQQAVAADKDVVCERETPTGTSLPTRRCRSLAQREADRRAVDAVEASTRARAGQPMTGKAGP